MRQCWGSPERVHQTHVAGHTEEQVVFLDGLAYLYFVDGLLKGVQVSGVER